MNEPWIVKHIPKTLAGVKGQDAALLELKKYIETYRGQKKKFALVHGPAGCGKTSSVVLLAQHYNLELIELNASDFRNAGAIENIMGSAVKQRSLFYKGKLILVDEADGLSGHDDRGGLTTVMNLAQDSTFPVILTCQNAYDEKLNSIRSKGNAIEFASPDYKAITQLLSEICSAESIKFEETALRTIARRCGGDIRAAITDAQTLAQVQGQITEQEVSQLEDRWRTESIVNALIKIFKNSDPAVALSAFDLVHEDLDKCILWIDENLPKEYTDPEDLFRAYDALSLANVFKGRIMRWQHWRFLVYVNALATAGVAVAKSQKPKGFVSYGPTTRLLAIWRANMKYQKRKGIAEKIAEKTHTSHKRTIQDTLPFVKVMIKHKPNLVNDLKEEFHLDEDEVAWLKN